MEAKKLGWKDLPIGGTIVRAGNAAEYKTGDWRSERPVVDKGKCINCLQCWIFCPDSSILVQDEKMAGYDYFHCKGCGICARVCPVRAIEMVAEENAASLPADEKGIRKPAGNITKE